MRAELSEDGTLSISSESAIESFALTHWFELWQKKDATLMVKTVERDGEGVRCAGFTIVEPNE